MGHVICIRKKGLLHSGCNYMRLFTVGEGGKCRGMGWREGQPLRASSYSEPVFQEQSGGVVLSVFGLLGGTALSAVTADFETGDDDMEAAISLDLAFETTEEVTLKFGDLAAAQ